MPALYNLALQRLLPGSFSVVGAARQPLTDDQFREELHRAVGEHSRTKPINEEVWKSFADHVFFIATPDDRGYAQHAIARVVRRGAGLRQRNGLAGSLRERR